MHRQCRDGNALVIATRRVPCSSGEDDRHAGGVGVADPHCWASRLFHCCGTGGAALAPPPVVDTWPRRPSATRLGRGALNWCVVSGNTLIMTWSRVGRLAPCPDSSQSCGCEIRLAVRDDESIRPPAWTLAITEARTYDSGPPPPRRRPCTPPRRVHPAASTRALTTQYSCTHHPALGSQSKLHVQEERMVGHGSYRRRSREVRVSLRRPM